ncbi:uncharacterized protein LOC134277783 [Saccostrea cucullata]|uniref:uncharacterized protein LOC134277783 n=1 Tax=Saccostrea cuccullata TaxID=36930 RepID=UPI002ED474A8
MENSVESCPRNITAVTESSTRLGCGQDRYGNDQYICVPNFDKTGLIELCYNGIMGIIERDPACQNINTRDRCYFAEPSCPNTTENINTTEYQLGLSTIQSIYNTTAINLSEGTFPQESSDSTGVIIGSVVAVVFIIILVLAVVLWKRNQKNKKQRHIPRYFEINKQQQEEKITGADCKRPFLSLADTTDDTKDLQQTFDKLEEVYEVRDTGVYSEIEERVQDFTYLVTNTKLEKRDTGNTLLKYLGDYSLWKTRLSDKFSTLTVDEVSVLFCFLCSDSGPPDFTDTEWLDMLNKIRQKVYNKENSVTREEAQQTLDRLKSRDYLWEDKDKITEDTKDETMYRIASINRDIPFHYSSYDTASVYLRSGRYNRKPGEKCLSCFDSVLDYLLILRLQMNILTHVTMEDTEIYDEIQQILNIPENIIKKSKDEREEFLTELRREGEAVHYRGRLQDSVDHVTWLWRYEKWARPDIVRSCIGLHPHNDIYIIDNKAYRKPSKIHSYEPEVRCFLYCLLLSEKYRTSFNEQSHRITKDKIRQRYFPDITDDGSVDLPDGITETHDGVITFISDDIRHDVMYAFVTECLVEDSDLEFFFTTASRDVISEYCRSCDYKRSEGERCLYIPDEPGEMYDLFIDSLQLDIIAHCTVSDWMIHDRISERLGVPKEILKWDQEARERYVEYAKRGTQTVHHARGMIVGCAGAGKTTLLKRLLGCSEDEIKKIKSTEGLEVHKEIFDLCDETKSLKARNMYTGDKKEESSATNIDSKTLTFFDFGGQCAYYACHQIYLTRRAFYVVVVDASKRLDQNVDKEVCDQEGSVFSGWTYGEYFVFWIKSIHTYCGSDNEADPKPTVLIVVTHWEEGNRQYQSKEALLNSLQQIFPKSTNLSMYITEDNVYFLSFPVKPLQDLERIVFNIASQQRWKENIPKEWAFFEIEINQRKHKEKILEVVEIATELSDKSLEGTFKQYEDMLRYYHDAGKVLYFNENQLKKSVIIDVQWFIDAFKYIITDKLHFKGIDAVQEDWDEYYKTGNLKDGLLAKIWEHKGDVSYKTRQQLEDFEFFDYYAESEFVGNIGNLLLEFMQRLGFVALGRESHYVPCMNRKKMEEELSNLIKYSESKSSVLIYRFTFLPFFLFFRLVVACMQESGWNVLTTHGTSCLYKDTAFFLFEGYNVVLSVTEESIQLQVLHSMPGNALATYKTQKIQETIENMLNDFVGQFNRKLSFVRGVRCKMESAKITAKDIREHFLLEKDIPRNDQEIMCPLHQVINRHPINPKELTKYWKM